MAREKICCIYRITSAIHPDRIYIGSTSDFTDRVRKHKSHLKHKTHHNIKLQSHVNKYGIDDFTFEIVEVIQFTTLENLIEREQYYIDTLKPYLNINLIANSSIGLKRSDETRKKIGKASEGRPMPEHVKKMLIEINTGSHHTQETKEKIRKGHLGKKKEYMVERNKGNTYGRANKGKKKSVPSPFKGKKKDKPSPLKGRKTGRSSSTSYQKGNVPWTKGKKLPYIPHKGQSEAMKEYWRKKKAGELGDKNNPQ